MSLTVYKYQDFDVPTELVEVIEAYKLKRQEILDKQKFQQVETKVKTMCYDMVLDILDQEQRARL